MDLVDEFGGGDYGENEARRTSASTKRSTGADYPSSNHVSHAVGNFAKNVSNYLTADVKKVFDQLCQAFTEAPILQQLDPERYIWVETDAFEHTIGGVLSQLTNNLGQLHPVAYFSRKMILAETRYKTDDGKFLAICNAEVTKPRITWPINFIQLSG